MKTSGRHSIVRAINNQISQVGISKTSISDIAKEAGLSASALYYYFPDKSSAILCALTETKNNYQTGLSRVAAERAINADLIKDLVAERFSILASTCLFDYLYSSCGNIGTNMYTPIKEMKEFELRFFSDIFKNLRIEKGGLYSKPTVLASSFIYSINGIATCQNLSQRQYILELQIDFTLQFLETLQRHIEPR